MSKISILTGSDPLAANALKAANEFGFWCLLVLVVMEGCAKSLRVSTVVKLFAGA